MKKISANDGFLWFITTGFLISFIAQICPQHMGEKILHYYAATLIGIFVYGLLGIILLSVFGLIFLRK